MDYINWLISFADLNFIQSLLPSTNIHIDKNEKNCARNSDYALDTGSSKTYCFIGSKFPIFFGKNEWTKIVSENALDTGSSKTYCFTGSKFTISFGKNKWTKSISQNALHTGSSKTYCFIGSKFTILFGKNKWTKIISENVVEVISHIISQIVSDKSKGSSTNYLVRKKLISYCALCKKNVDITFWIHWKWSWSEHK